MPEFKVVINDVKSGKTYQKVVSNNSLLGKKIGEKLPGDPLGFDGYEFEVRGGSDTAGIPIRKEVEGFGKKLVLLKKGAGFNPVKRKKPHTKYHYFLSKKKSVRGNTVSQSITQVNLKITKYGSKKVEDILGVKKEETKAEEAPKETKTKKEE